MKMISFHSLKKSPTPTVQLSTPSFHKVVMTDTYIDEEESLIGCRRRRSDRRKDFSITHTEEEEDTDRPRYKMAPKSFEHQIYITSMNVGHRCAYLCRGLISCFVSRLDGISNFCAIYSFTGILFTVSCNSDDIYLQY